LISIYILQLEQFIDSLIYYLININLVKYDMILHGNIL